MKYIPTIVISFLLALVVVIGALNLPAHWFSLREWGEKLQLIQPKLGTAVTTISSTDQLSNFPTTYNTNLYLSANTTTANKFAGLQEFNANASSTIFSCYTCYFGGTATSSFSTAGALSLITPLTVANGGTGSTTLSQYHVLLGSSTNAIGIVEGVGTSGQFLTSGGAGTSPSWTTAAVDTAINYLWSGIHGFIGSRTNIKNLFASSTVANPLVLNDVSLAFQPSLPTTLAATSSLAVTASSTSAGTVYYASGNNKTAVIPSGISISSNTATTSVFSITIPANELQKNNAIHARTFVSSINCTAGSNYIQLALTYGSTVIASSKTICTAGVNGGGYIDVDLIANNSTTAQIGSYAMDVSWQSGSFINGSAFDSTSAGHSYGRMLNDGTATENSGTALTLQLDIRFTNSSANDTITTKYTTIEKIAN